MQALPPLFLRMFNARPRNDTWNTVRLYGPKHNATVTVTYIPAETLPHGMAVGFEGNNWKRFFLENELDETHKLMFVNGGSSEKHCHIFNVTIFNQNGIALQNHDPLTHVCSQHFHEHHINLPFYFSTIPDHAIERNMLTVPRQFVREQQLYNYIAALLCFGELTFCASLHTRLGLLEVGDITHQEMYLDWEEFLTTTGLTTEKLLRFEMHPDKGIPNELAYFNVC